MTTETQVNKAEPAAPTAKAQPDAPFGVNEMRLSLKQWLAVAAIVLTIGAVTPAVWKHLERFNIPTDYRIPYALSSDYWLYQRRADSLSSVSIPIVGDSVVWGEYVQKDGTLSHFLSQEAGDPGRFANCGVNGVFPLALQGLIDHYGGALANRKVIVQCNMLWQSSPKADMSEATEQTFNHTMLVPQGFGEVPCYKADAAARMGSWIESRVGFYGWVSHMNCVYYKNLSIPKWSLEEDGSDPPTRPNAWANPLARINFEVPTEPSVDTARGPLSRRHKAWNAGGAQPSHFEWVEPGHSLQWRAFQKLVVGLRDRHADVCVVFGPFNEHMVAEDQRDTYRHYRDIETGWLTKNGFTVVVPATLPPELYADASHPLTVGYALMAHEVYTSPEFTAWLGSRRQ